MDYVQPIITSHNAPNQRGIGFISGNCEKWLATSVRRTSGAFSALKYKAHIIQRDIENPRAQETNPNSRHTREVVRIKQWQKIFFKAM